MHRPDWRLGFPGVEVNRRADGAVALRKSVHELHHTAGLGISERLKDDGVDDGEDSGVSSNDSGTQEYKAWISTLSDSETLTSCLGFSFSVRVSGPPPLEDLFIPIGKVVLIELAR